MTVRQSKTFHNTVYAGTHGNLSIAKLSLTAKAAAIDDVFEVVEMPIGVELTGLRLITAGLGASVTVDVAIGDTTIATGQDVAGAAAIILAIEPVYLTAKETLSVTIKGGAATGTLTVMPEYVNVGY